MKQTFAQYLINKVLPSDMHVDKPVTKGELEHILNEVYKKHEGDYSRIVMALKRLGDTFSTYEGVTMGIDEISAPNEAERDRIIKEFKPFINNAKTEEDKIKHLGVLQDKIIKNDTSNVKDSASVMVNSGAMAGKKVQLVKLRSTPVVVADSKGGVVPELFEKSYSEGQPILQHWLQNTESRFNVAQGKLSVSAPGELSKVLHNVLRSSVVSKEDCGTHKGILLSTDNDLVGRYLAEPVSTLYGYNTYISENVLKKIRDFRIEKVLVRSPQTCEATGVTVCSHCMGHSISTGKKMQIGDNAGVITAGSMGEPLTQMTLSAKHSNAVAGQLDLLKGEQGFRQFVEMPKTYPQRKVFCEVYGVIDRILPASQGGKDIIIRGEQPQVPERFIAMAKPYQKLKNFWDYYVPPNISILKDIKPGQKVYPGMELTNGTVNLADVARLKGLGMVRTAAAQGINDVYKNTNVSMDRRHFELLARAAYNYVKMYQVPSGFKYKRGEVVPYNDFLVAIENMRGHELTLEQALDKTLQHQINDITAGTTITPAIIEHLKQYNIKNVTVVDNLQIEAVAASLTRVPDLSDDWIATLNHRRLKDAITTAARTGQASNIHGYNPMTAYAYGAELENGPEGKY